MITKFVAILLLVEFALAQTTKSTLSSETNEKNTFNSEVPKNQLNSSLNAEKSAQPNLSQSSSPSEDSTGIDETTESISTQKSYKENFYDARFPSTYASPTSAKVGLDENIKREDASAMGKLQDTRSESDDPKNEFIRFVQTALKKSLSMQPSPLREKIYPSVVRKLIDITRQLRKQTGIPEKPSNQTASAKNFDWEDVSRHPEEHIYNEAQEDFNKNSHKSSKKEISRSPLSTPTTRTFEYQTRNRQNPRREYFQHRFRDAQSVPKSRTLSPNYNSTRTSSQRRLGQLQSNFPRGTQSNRNKNRYKPTYSEKVTREYVDTRNSFTNMLQNQVKSSVASIEKTEEELYRNRSRSQAENARYSFSSDVQDDINGYLHQRQETREGTKVTGSYTYEDGFFRRTVHYVADEKGYRVVKQEVEEIGDGPLYNPYGSAKIQSYIAGKNLNYRITASDLIESPQVPNEQPKYRLDRGYEWEYQ